MSSFGGLFEDHLSVDVVVAYVDGELSLVPFQRAAAHLQRCPMCAAEVSDQMFARESLRSAASPRMPSSLLASLQSIPVALPAPGSAPGIRIDSATGRAVRITRSVGAGLNQGMAPADPTAEPGRLSHAGVQVTRSRRFRLGAGAIVAGIAVGAFASGPSEPADPGTPSVVPTLNRPVVQPAGLTVTDPVSPTDR